MSVKRKGCALAVVIGRESDVVAAFVARKVLTATQIKKIEGKRNSGLSLLVAVHESGFDTEPVLKTASDFLDIPLAELSDRDRTVVTLVSAAVARRHVVLPLRYNGDRLVLAMGDPLDQGALDEVAALTGLVVEPVLASFDSLHAAIDEEFDSSAKDPELVGKRLGVGAEEATLDIHELLEMVLAKDASDLHLTIGRPPNLRINGDLAPLLGYPELTGPELQKCIYGILTQKQRERFEADLELDFSYSLPGKARFRVNVYVQRQALGAAFRLIPFLIKSTEDLGLPKRVEEFAGLPRGLVLVTGPTGSGKSTTLASIVDLVNRTRPCHIMTVEDPIEFLHAHKMAMINQREVGQDTHGFGQALRHVLRQDPDVILVGEMRDLETIQMAVTAAETGHLVFGTLHTQDAPQAIDRMIDVFPPHQQQQIRVQLGGALQAVVAQQLLATRDGAGRVAAVEVLIATPAVRNLIREAKTHQIYSQMQAGGKYGMVTMDDALAALVRKGKITMEAATQRCHDVGELARLSVANGRPAAAIGPVIKARVLG